MSFPLQWERFGVCFKNILGFFAGWGLVTCIQYLANYHNGFLDMNFTSKCLFSCTVNIWSQILKACMFLYMRYDVQIIFADGYLSHCCLKLSMNTWVHRKMHIVSVFGTKLKNTKLSWWNKCCCFSMCSKGLIFTPYFWMHMWEQSWSL